MAYKPKEWVCGDTITADDLNHMENGIVDAGSSASMVVQMNAEGVADKTWQEVYDALANGTLVYALSTLSSASDVEADIVAHAPILMAAGGSGNYGAVMMSTSLDGTSVQMTMLIADSADSYLRAMTSGGH